MLSLSAVPLAAQAPLCAGTKDECQQKEILELKQALAQAQVQLMQRDFQVAWATLEREVRVRLKAKSEDVIDMTTLTIKPKVKDAK